MTKRLWRALFHTPKHAQKPERQAPMRVSVSLLTMLACCAVLCASSLAWFNDAQAASVASIQAASYSLTVKVDGSDESITSYTFTADDDNEKTFTITASGTASTGYCEIKVGEEVYRTVAITPNESLALTIAAEPAIGITFTAVWGTYSPTGDETLYGSETQLSLSENPAPVDDTETDENEGGNDEENGESTDENGEPTDDEQPTRGDDTDNNAGSDPSGDNGNENPTGTPEPTTPSDDTSDTENPEGEQSPEPTETPEETEQPTEPEPSENPEPSEAPTETTPDPEVTETPAEETTPNSENSDTATQSEDAEISE